MKNVKNKFNKELIKDLPRAIFQGKIEVIENAEDVQRAVSILERANIIGLDTETRPNFRGGRQNKVALLQISTYDVCFLFRLKATGMTDEMTNLFTNPAILKVGLSLRDDFRQLNNLREFTPVNYVELQDFVKPFGIQDLSLQKLYANILGGQINKGQQLSNWESETLSEAQQKYAATDAWACIMLYEEMQRMRHEGFQVVYAPDEVPEPVFVGLEKPKTTEDIVKVEGNEEQSSANSKPRKKRKAKDSTNSPESFNNNNSENEQTTVNVDSRNDGLEKVGDNVADTDEKPNKRRKKRRSTKTKKESIDNQLSEEVSTPVVESENMSKRSKRRKSNKTPHEENAKNGVNISTNDQNSNNAKETSNERTTKSNKSRNRKGGEKRREPSRRPIPEMAAPLDEAPAKKKSGFMKKMLLGIVEKFSKE